VLLGRVAIAGTDIGHAIDGHPGYKTVGMGLPGNGFQAVGLAGFLQVRNNPVAFQGGHGDIGGTAVGAVFFTGQVEFADKTIVDVDHMFQKGQFGIQVHVRFFPGS